MKIAIVGTGYVGLVSAACFAELGHEVIGVDIDEAKVKKLKNGVSPIYEPGLDDIIARNLTSGRLSFTTQLTEALPTVSVLFCAVATPPNKDHTADLRAVFAVCDAVAEQIDHDLVFVNKSTVPVGTGLECEKRIKATLTKRGAQVHIPVISNPEFLREGSAVGDTLHPDRIIVGINGDHRARSLMEELYKPFTRTERPLVFMSRESAEIVKYASNAFLATKISFINMLTELTEVTGADIRDVAKGMGLDERIGPRFLHAGIGYGGSCFPKDVKALLAIGRKLSIPLSIIKATQDVNTRQRERFFEHILNTIPENASIGIWGLSFKPNTDDMRESPSLDLLPMLLKLNHIVRAYDPVAMENASRVLPKEVAFVDSPMAAAKDADAVILLTEWDTFRGIDLKELKTVMRGRLLFDGRNVFDPDLVRAAGLQYFGIGIGPAASSPQQAAYSKNS